MLVRRIAKEYTVSGKVNCTRHNFDEIGGIETFSHLSGNLTISKLGFNFEADNGTDYQIEFENYTKLEFKEFNDTKYTHWWIRPNCIVTSFDFEASKIESTKTLWLEGLSSQQIEEIKKICDIINNEVDVDCKEIMVTESNISNIIKTNHKNEIISFIEQFADDIFINLKYYMLVQNYFVYNGLFKRKMEDINRREFSIDANPERTQKLTDIKFVNKYDSFLGSEYPVIQISHFDDQHCIAFINVFYQLINFFTPEIEKMNTDNAPLDVVYIVWEALIEIVIEYYHDYCITTLGFNDFGGGFDKMVDYMSTHEFTNPTSIMTATYYIIKEDSLDDLISNVYERILDELNNCKRRNAQNDFANALKNPSPKVNKTTIFDIDLMTGLEFEQFVAKLFEKKGYTVEVTKASGDQGIDVIAEKGGTKIGIQAKCYSSTVGNSAVQEAVAGKQFYRCDKAMVITNNYFTPSAEELATANDVILWNRDTLSENLV